VTRDPNDDIVMRTGLQAMGAYLVEEVGPGVAFALFVDWRDGRRSSYLSNASRRSVAAALAEWLDRATAAPSVPPGGTAPVAPPTALQTKAVAIVHAMREEDVDATLFLFGGEPGQDKTAGETAYASSIPNVRQYVEQLVAAERGRS
jgi:hypothetical protein